MFDKILIANRGEIACRVIQSARRMGIASVAVYSEADREALHVSMADEAVCIGPSPAIESYLSAAAIIEACQSTGAQALHPGYGFLSENAAFAEALCEAGISFIGPSPAAITAMGDKITAKKLAEKAGVSTITGYAGVIADAAHALEVANDIGYPVMLKASAGGGGKGMRTAHRDEECVEGFERASSEARTSFGDERIFIEKLITDPRHIEIQVLADTHGGVVFLGERECSIQRRHQKIIEEAPCPLLDQPMREAMGAQAIALARAVDYRSAGTVEFIVDAERNFYFLEMNTRLQVEHPVTELVTGLDLVELMIRIAAGEPLPITQAEVKLEGWAIEARIYAEDPFRDFLPAVGRLTRYRPPPVDEHVRIDSGVAEGSEVSIYYDPLIAKLITYGATRAQATQQMCSALDEFQIQGVAQNMRFLRTLLAHPRFVEARLSTNLIAEEFPDGFSVSDTAHSDPGSLIAVVAVVHRKFVERALQLSGPLPGCERAPGERWVVASAQTLHPVTVASVDGGYEVHNAGRTYTLRTRWQLADPILRGTLNDQPVVMQVSRNAAGYRLAHAGAQIEAQVLSPRAAELSRFMLAKEQPDLSQFLLCPMPGLLLSVAVQVGQDIKEGEPLAIVEAMKMENTLRGAQDGTVAEILASPGDSVAVDQPIMRFE